MAVLARMVDGPLRNAQGRGSAAARGAGAEVGRGLLSAVEGVALAPREGGEKPREALEERGGEVAEDRGVGPASPSASTSPRPAPLVPGGESVRANDEEALRGRARAATADLSAIEPGRPRSEPRAAAPEPRELPRGEAVAKSAARAAVERPLSPAPQPHDGAEMRPRSAATTAPLVLRERVIERTIERVVQTTVVAPARPEAPAAPPAPQAAPRREGEAPREAGSGARALPARDAAPPLPAGGPGRPEMTPAPSVGAKASPAAAEGAQKAALPPPRPVAAPPPPSPPRRAETAPAPEPPRPAPGAPAGGRAPTPAVRPTAAPLAPAAAPAPILQRVVPKPGSASASAAASPRSAPPVAAPQRAPASVVRVSVGRLEVHLKPAAARPSSVEVTLPRAHEIDPGLSFGAASAGRW